MSLKQKTIGGLVWSGIDTIGLNLIRIGITIVLARLLQPSDFGLIAMLNVFIAVSDTIVQGGFTTALIRKVKVQTEDYSTVFTYNLALSVTLYIVIFFTSPFIAGFYDQPLLIPIAKVVGLVLIFNAFSIIQNISLRRNFNFKSLALINLLSTFLSGCVGITMAIMDFGVWSLVAQLALKSLLASLFFWFFSRVKIRIGFNLSSFREDFGFGYKILLSNIINTLSMEAYNVIIGKLYNVKSLGYYYQANRLSSFSYNIISNMFKSVSFPILSSIQENEERLSNAYLKFIRLVAFISFPLMMLLIIIANPLFQMLLTDKWLESVPYFQLLCITGIFIPLIVVSGNMPLIKGRSDIFLKVEIYFKVQLILALVITAGLGIKAMVIGFVIHIIIQFLINIYLVFRFFNIPVQTQLKSVSYAFAISLSSAVITFFMKFAMDKGSILLFFQIVTFILIYVILQFAFKSKELMEIKEVFKQQLKQRSE